MLIYLTGFMGSGKTAVGRALARRLGVAFVDTDATVEAEAGRSIARIFADEGEAGFRERESRALESCSRRDDAVIATGGGIVESPSNVETMLATGRVVFLDCDFAVLSARVAADGVDRPLFRDPEAARARFELRRPAYERCHMRLAVHDESPETLAERLCRWLETPCAT